MLMAHELLTRSIGTVRHVLSNKMTKKNIVDRIPRTRRLMVMMIFTGRNHGSQETSVAFVDGIGAIHLCSAMKRKASGVLWLLMLFRSDDSEKTVLPGKISSSLHHLISCWARMVREWKSAHFCLIIFFVCIMHHLIMSMRTALRASHTDTLSLLVDAAFPRAALSLITIPVFLLQPDAIRQTTPFCCCDDRYSRTIER